MKSNSTPSEMRPFLTLWLTQSLSTLGSSMTGFALVLWSYQQQGSALGTALLSVCTYAPYVLVSIFAGTLSDRLDKKKTLIVCDLLAALSTLCVLALLLTGRLRVGHLYALSALGGLMNTVQQPASEVTVSLLTPRRHVQRVSSLQALSNSLVTVVTPMAATALYTLLGLNAVIVFDLCTCAVAVLTLALFIRIPRAPRGEGAGESLLASARSGLSYLRRNRGILDLILLLSCINLAASMYNAALPALILPRAGEAALGAVNTVSGLAMLAGSALMTLLPAPKSRVRVIFNALLFSMSTENLLLALGRSPALWCLGAALGWVAIPAMNANMNALLRTIIPLNMQGRVYAARNTLQFFTIPLGYLLGGWLVDRVAEPLMASLVPGHPLYALLGAGKGAGASLVFLALAIFGMLPCLLFRRDRHIWALEPKDGEASP